MNWKILGPFIVVLVVLVVFPVLPQLLQMVSLATSGEMPVDPNAPKPGSAPPLLNEGNLVGTVWEVEPRKNIKIKVTLNAGGDAVATTDNELVKKLAGTDTLAGKWSVNGAKLNVSTFFQGKDIKTDLDIIGDRVFKDGREIVRIQ
ncbi:MAG TPA: hypothetical protein PLI09_08940 [Candidatus Hydrogenedentes bacterium]|nr:hypothetical protein [Candidatus Hydrogenedentota bacterium]